MFSSALHHCGSPAIMMLADDSSRVVRHTWLVSELAANQDSVTENLGWVRFMNWSTQTEMERRASCAGDLERYC